MNKGIYIALSGGVGRYEFIDIISQNLANANTIGYKQDRVSFKDYLVSQLNRTQDIRNPIALNILSDVKTDFSNGSLLRTGNPLDIAISGRGFISLEGDRYTRRGDFKVDSEGYLVTHDNIRIMGEGGPIQLPNGKVEISSSGDISVNGIKVDRLKIVDFTNLNSLVKAGNGIFLSAEEGKPASGFTVEQSYLEMSNVNVVKEMVVMINALREFEAFQKAIQTFDEATTKVINEMARL